MDVKMVAFRCLPATYRTWLFHAASLLSSIEAEVSGGIKSYKKCLFLYWKSESFWWSSSEQRVKNCTFHPGIIFDNRNQHPVCNNFWCISWLHCSFISGDDWIFWKRESMHIWQQQWCLVTCSTFFFTCASVVYGMFSGNWTKLVILQQTERDSKESKWSTKATPCSAKSKQEKNKTKYGKCNQTWRSRNAKKEAPHKR